MGETFKNFTSKAHSLSFLLKSLCRNIKAGEVNQILNAHLDCKITYMVKHNFMVLCAHSS